ncbi:MAG TPA: hypothetical protein VN027_01160 [Isoptericola sp.]|nr:hypothetical protein [Isoptericola sp.]
MPARAVVLPGTSLLVPGAGGGADRLGDVRAAVAAALDSLVATCVASAPAGPDGDAPLVVLAPVPRGAAGGFGRRRPSLAGAGIADRWVPDVAAWPRHDLDPVPAAHVPASVALLALRAALRRAGHDGPPDVVVLEMSDAGDPPAEAVAALHRAPALVVAGGAAPGTPGAAAVPDVVLDVARDAVPDAVPDPSSECPVLLAPAVSAVLDAAVSPRRWSWRVTTVPGGHEHLPPSYGIAEGSAG